MSFSRRDLFRMMGAGILAPKIFTHENASFIYDISTPQKTLIDKLFDNAIVIDALVQVQNWDNQSQNAISSSGYSGIHISLPDQNLQAALQGLASWNQRIDNNPGTFMKVVKTMDFESAKRHGKLAVLFGFQNATILDGMIENLDPLYQLGSRCIQLTYNSRNLLGDGCTERTNAGLSEFGVSVVERMNELGIIVDLSHCGYQTTMDGIQFSNPGACFTHTMCEALYRGHPRAKTDEQIRAMAGKGGMIGIVALGYFVGDDPGGTTTLDTYLDHIDHAVKVAGINHVGLSTDFPIQGISPWATRENWYEPRLKIFKPTYRLRWPPWIPELDSPDRFRAVAHGLDRRGYRTADIEKILGLNWLGYFREVL